MKEGRENKGMSGRMVEPRREEEKEGEKIREKGFKEGIQEERGRE